MLRVLFICCFFWGLELCFSFTPRSHVGVGRQRRTVASSTVVFLAAEEREDAAERSLREEAARLLAQAKAIREELPPESVMKTESITSPMAATKSSPWSLPPLPQHDGDDNDRKSSVAEYRLYVDIGREPGTWMDPRWGMSGQRIEFSLDVRFTADEADENTRSRMVKDNFGGKSSPVYLLQTGENARLRSGFERMRSYGGGYRIDIGGKNGVGTARFFIAVERTPEGDSIFGDVFVPEGCLYFSLPSFGRMASQLSTKEGPVTVRQIGWHTGWRRKESRIVGIFRAVAMEKARKRDGF